MASSVHSTPKSHPVYWDCWLRNDGAPAWSIRLYAFGLGYRGPAFTCYDVDQLIRFVATHDRVYPICLSDNVHVDVAYHFARRLLAAGLVVFSDFTGPFYIGEEK